MRKPFGFYIIFLKKINIYVPLTTIIDHHYTDLRTIEKQNFIFQRLLEEKLPDILTMFKKSYMVLESYTLKWFVTLYSSCVNQECFYRIFDVFLLEGWCITHAVGLALLKNS